MKSAPKIIPNIDEKLEHWSDDPDLNAQCPTFRETYRQACAMNFTTAGEKSIDLLEIGFKFKRAEGPDLELSETEFRLLKSTVDSNGAKFLAHFHAQAMLKLMQAETGVNGKMLDEYKDRE